MHHDIVFNIFLIFTGAAIFATLALYARQALIISYIALGIVCGPSVTGLVTDQMTIKQIAHIGIIFLLFLLGLNLQPKELGRMFKEAIVVTTVSSIIFALVGFSVPLAMGYSMIDSVLIGVAVIFSSTIIGLKLLPTTVLHHQRTGEIIISILLLQDLIAIVVLLLLQGFSQGDLPVWQLLKPLAALPALIAIAYFAEKWLLDKLFAKFDRIHEFVFLITIGWCLGIAHLAYTLGLSHEIGAFIAGIALATSPISLFIAESLKPLRDFFLVIFFFSIGASFDLTVIDDVIIPASIIGISLLAIKPLTFKMLLRQSTDKKKRSGEVGVRLGQISEFSLLIAVLGLDLGILSEKASSIIQVATMITFIFSSGYIVMTYPTPIAVSDKLRRD